MKMKVMQMDEFQEFMRTMKRPTYPSTTAQVIHTFESLWTAQKIVKFSSLQDYFGEEESDLKNILNMIFSPAYLSKSFRSAMNLNLDLISDHQSLKNLMTRSNVSYQTIRDYFSRFQSYPKTIMEFRGTLFYDYEYKQWVKDKIRPPLKISDLELNQILEFYLKSQKNTGLEERLNALLDCISKIGDQKTITLQQMEDLLGCSSTQLHELLEELFLKVEGHSEFYIYRSVIYEYRRASFMDKLCLKP